MADTFSVLADVHTWEKKKEGCFASYTVATTVVHACITREHFVSNCPTANKCVHICNEAVAGTAASWGGCYDDGITLKTHPYPDDITPDTEEKT